MVCTGNYGIGNLWPANGKQTTNSKRKKEQETNMPSQNFIGLIYSCDLDNPCDLLDDRKRIDGAERIDPLTVKSFPVKCKKFTNHLFSVFNEDTISLGMLN